MLSIKTKKKKQRDIEKNKLAKDRGITLITLRYDEELTEEFIKKRLKDFKKQSKMDKN